MKRILTLCLAFAFFASNSYAAFTEGKTEIATQKKENYGAFKNAETRAAAEFFVKMSRKDYEQFTGKHMSVFERAAFKVQQKRMQKELQKIAEGSTESKLIGVLAGLVFSLIGVLLVYLLSNDRTMRTWAWIGAIISFLIYGAIII